MISSLRMLLWNLFQGILGTSSFKKRIIASVVQGPGAILEIGCATGNLAGAFTGRVYVGVDIEDKSICLARQKFTGPNFTFLAGDIRSMALPVALFEYVVLSHTAHHLDAELVSEIIAAGVARLRLGGRFVLLDMHRPEARDAWAKRFYRYIDRGQHFRTTEELKIIIERESRLTLLSHDRIPCRKYGVPIIDQCLLVAVRQR